MVIGGIERSILKNKIQNENKKLFLCPIEVRNSVNIDNIIKKYVKKRHNDTVVEITGAQNFIRGYLHEKWC
jgi:hypothetical protein